MATIAAGDLPNLTALTDDDKFMVIDAPSTTKAPRLLTATIARTYMQNGAVPSTSLGVAGGVATLGGDGKLTAAQVPAAVSGVTSINGTLTGAVTGILTTADKGVTVASLTGGKVPTSQLPGSIQTASRSTSTSVSTAIDFNYQQNVFLLNTASPAFTFTGASPGAKTSVVLVQDSTGYRNPSFPGSNFYWDTLTPVYPVYPQDAFTLGFEVREDGVTVAGFGVPMDRSEMWNVFTGIDTFSRMLMFGGASGSNIVSGTLRWTFFKARRSMLVNNLQVWVNGASNPTTATAAGLLLGTVDPSTWTTTVAAVASSTTTFQTASASGTSVSVPLSAAYQVLGGRWYGFGVMYYSSSNVTNPGIISTRQAAGNNPMQVLPVMCGVVTGLTAMPTVGTPYTLGASAGQINASDTLYWGQLL